jgi:arylsulfatase A-like enzyme
MSRAGALVHGAVSGLLAGAGLGAAEVAWMAAQGGLSDGLALLYAAGLYGGIGSLLGAIGGLSSTLVPGWGPVEGWRRHPEAFAGSMGAATALSPLLLFVLFYLVNKDVFAEQGIPAPAKLAILGGVVAMALLEVLVVRNLRASVSARTALIANFLAFDALLALGVGVLFSVPSSADRGREGFTLARPVAPALADKPNVLMIVVDTLRADALGTYGHPGNPTPAIDALAADSVVFEQHVAAASWTRSSFASLFTSRIPSSHVADKKASRLADEVVMLSEVLQAGGVKTGNLANNINVTGSFNFDQGYDAFVYEAPVYPFGATESVFGLTLYKVVHKLHERIGGKLGLSKDVATFYQPAEVVFEDAKAFIDGSKDARWYLGLHLMEPHDPYFDHPYLTGDGPEYGKQAYGRAEHEAPAADEATALAALYAGEVQHLDRKIAAFVQYLKETGRYDDTLIVLTADHGEEFGEHGGFWHGTTLYDEQIHIPLFVKLPAQRGAGTRVSWQSRAIDVAPTITTALGLSADAAWMGKDLLGDALAPAPAEVPSGTPDAACAAYSKPGHRVAISEEDFEGNVLRAVRTGAFKLIEAEPGGPRGLPEVELFDLVVDAAETKNLATSGESRCGTFLSDLPVSLSADLDAAIAAAASGATSGGEQSLSPADRARLCSLGYMSGKDCE